MRLVLAALSLAGLCPLLLAIRANRATSLAHALGWTLSAWLCWGFALGMGDPDRPGMDGNRYCALCLTGCAGIAVLGARRPHVGAWNFVIVGLFAVMVLPLIEMDFLGTHPVDPLRIFFLSATVAVGILNYLPTRFAPAAVVLMSACTGEMAFLYMPDWFSEQRVAMGMHGLLMTTPWIAWMCLWDRDRDRAEFDRLWLGFRDRWGLLWSQRVREQFNAAAQNAGWGVTLSWRGLVRQAGAPWPTLEDQEKFLQTLQAVLQRFLPGPQNGKNVRG